MNIKKLINEKKRQLDSQNYIEFTIDELNKLRTDEVQYLIDHFHGHTMVKLPQPEISFFEWLKRVDRLIWDDLWEELQNQVFDSKGPIDQKLLDLLDFWSEGEHDDRTIAILF